MQAVLALFGIGLMLMAIAVQFSLAGIGWFFVLFVAAVASLYAAFSERLRGMPVAGALGLALLIVGAVGWTLGAAAWVGLGLVGFGVAFLVAFAAIELPKGRHAHWRFQKRGTVH